MMRRRKRSRRVRPNKVQTYTETTLKVPSYRLREWVKCVRVWTRGKGHKFAGNGDYGIAIAQCEQCGLMVTVNGRVQSDVHVWIQKKDFLGSSSRLREIVSSLVSCGDVMVEDVHGA